MNETFSFFGGIPSQPVEKPVVFVSYHHGADQGYYNRFATVFADTYRIIRDNSLRNEISSDDAEYIMRRIRELDLTGTSCTIVLCGKETPWRKFVDWEIKATLDKQHGLVGIGLPNNPVTNAPDRFLDNNKSGYAVWLTWEQLFPNQRPNVAPLRAAIEDASATSKELIDNTRPLMSRNGETAPRHIENRIS
jgi:MTH538 TIR-like domain (DUF1863).